ncbi:MAG: hypothetical protein CUN55_03140 [Phototrophicales bacterium]|nr:MAG: hypothetical protein CUN55_03140 [Phototrophicales bacterium]
MTEHSSRILRFRPTIDTKFHIDYSWWEGQEAELHAYLISLLPEEKRDLFVDREEAPKIDWIDPKTAEVKQIDALQHALQTLVGNVEELRQTPLVDAVFRVFLANANTPLSPIELEERIGRPARTILRTLSGARVYRGLRPAITEDNED